MMADIIQTDQAPALPNNVEAEAALLGAMMIENRLIDQIVDKVRSYHFFEPLHARIFEAIVREASFGRVANPVTLRPYFDGDESLKVVGGSAYLAQLTGSGAAVLGARDFAQQVRDLAQLRALIGAGQWLIDKAMDTSADVAPGTILGELEGEIAKISDEASEGIVETSAADAMRKAVEPDRSDPGVTTGIEGLDRALGPIKRKQLVILAGRPGMGKSACASSMALGVAKQGNGVLYITLEMSDEELGQRMCADLSFDGFKGINYGEIESQNLSAEHTRALLRLANELEDLPLQIVDAPALRSSQIDTYVRRWKRRFAARGVDLALVIVDYLQLIRTDEREKDLYTRITEVSKRLKQTAKAHDVGVVACAQLSREVEKRQDKRPTLADLRDSGQIEQDADGVMFLFRHDYYLAKIEPDEDSDERAKWEQAMEAHRGKIEFIVAKRRGRPEAIGRGRFYGAFQAVR